MYIYREYIHIIIYILVIAPVYIYCISIYIYTVLYTHTHRLDTRDIKRHHVRLVCLMYSCTVSVISLISV